MNERERQEEVIEILKTLKSSAHQYFDSTMIENIDLKSFNFVLDGAIKELQKTICKESPEIFNKDSVQGSMLNDDLISRQAVIEQTYNWSQDEFLRTTNAFDHLRRKIKALPSVQPEQKVGKWIFHPDWQADGECGYECNQCGMGSDIDYDFCMRCGAKMEEVEE